LSNESRTNHWKSYKTSADVNKQLFVLSAHVLSTLNAHISEANMKESSDADWMSVRLKEEIVIVLWIKLMFVWIVKNQSIKDQKITQNKRNLWKEVTQKVQCVVKNQNVRD